MSNQEMYNRKILNKYFGPPRLIVQICLESIESMIKWKRENKNGLHSRYPKESLIFFNFFIDEAKR